MRWVIFGEGAGAPAALPARCARRAGVPPSTWLAELPPTSEWTSRRRRRGQPNLLLVVDDDHGWDMGLGSAPPKRQHAAQH